MKHLDLFSGIAGFAIALKKVWGKQYENVGHSEIDKDACSVYHKHFKDSKCLGDIQKISFLQQDSPVKTLQLLDGERDLPENVRDSSANWQDLLTKLSQNGLSLRMFPDFFLSTKEEIWHSSSKRFPSSGIAWRGKYLMLNSSEWLKDVNVCGLSEVLETQVQEKYYLSKKAIDGIIRRSERNGRGGYVFLQEGENTTTQRLRLLSLEQFKAQYGGGHDQSGKTLTLRKLTPLEKERLMGYEEGWTDLISTDARRGKVLGNGIVPKIAEEIAEQIKKYKEVTP